MLFSTLLPITLLVASAAAYPTCDPAGEYLPGVPAPDSEPGKWIPGVPAPDSPTPVSAAPSQICERTCHDGPTECQAEWVRHNQRLLTIYRIMPSQTATNKLTGEHTNRFLLGLLRGNLPLPRPR